MSTIPVFKEMKDHHVYRNSDGNVVPSVTTILKIINREELLGWANFLGFKRINVKHELECHAYIGTVTHNTIDEYFKTGKVKFESFIDPKRIAENLCARKAFLSFTQFFMENRKDFKIIQNERSLSGEKFGGTLDLLAEYKDYLTICDFKTSKDFYLSMFLQMAAYDLLVREKDDIKVKGYMVILLDKKTGKPARIKLVDDKDEMKAYRECFMKLVDFYYDYYLLNQKYWGKELI
jgi:hypothetical protein